MENQYTKVRSSRIAARYLQAVYRSIEVSPKKASKILFQIKPKTYQRLHLDLLAVFALNRSYALNSKRSALSTGFNTSAMKIWTDLPQYIKELWKNLPEESMQDLHRIAGIDYYPLPNSSIEQPAEVQEEENFPQGSIPTGRMS